MSSLTQQNASLGAPMTTSLQDIMLGMDIQPGSTPSYQLCKSIYLYHPMGAKMVETPVRLAQTKPREIAIKDIIGEKEVREAFQNEWEQMQADYYIRGCMYQSRIYGAGAVGVGFFSGDKPVETSEPLDLSVLAKGRIYFNVFDPLNVSGSLVLDQDPNSPTFQKHGDLSVNGVKWHRSRTCVMFNEQPVYIAYSGSAFGYSGRSVYQRVLYPLKSFINSMRTDDMVTVKAGLLVAMIKQAGSIVNKIMQGAASIKRALLKIAQTDNVLSIDVDEKIESLNMQNTDTAMKQARSNIIQNIATGSDIPAKILEQESFAEGFGEGSEDTKNIMRFVDSVRTDMQPLYRFFDRICQHRAWSPEFFAEMQDAYPEAYGSKTYEEAFYEWRESFRATWPSLLDEPDSEKSKHEKVQLEGIISISTQLVAMVQDPANKASLVEWIQGNVNELPHLFKVPLALNIDDIENYQPPTDEADNVNATGDDRDEGGQGAAPTGARPTLVKSA